MRYVRTIAAVCILLCTCSMALALSKEEFLELVEAAQEEMSDIEIGITMVRDMSPRQKASFEKDPDAVKQDRQRFRTIMAGPAGGKYYLEVDTESLRGDGEGHLVNTGNIRTLAFDGKITREIRDELTFPRHIRFISQLVFGDRQTSSMRSYMWETGINLVPKYFEDVGLSQVLRQSTEWKFEHVAGNIYRVWCPSVDEERPCDWEITMDLDRGGMFTELTRRHNGNGRQTFGDLKWERAGGAWALKSGRYGTGLENDIGWSVTCDVWKVNQGVGDEAFTFDFDPTRRVSDQVIRASYKREPGGRDELLSEIGDSMDEPPEAADEVEATADGAQVPLSEDADRTEPPRASIGFYIALLAVGIAILVSYLIIRRGARRP